MSMLRPDGTSYLFLPGAMDGVRNQYREVCVYCHTPHGANMSMPGAPLWNRTKPSGQYQVYSRPTTLGQPITQPGVNSIMCLSCHDGTVAIDSIINMPGSGRYNAAQETAVSQAFLNSWPNAAAQHGTLADCTFCHNNQAGFTGSFEVFVIGKDLNDDHPVGVLYPTSFGAGVDFNVPDGEVSGAMSFFDSNGNNKPDKSEIRMYQSGDGYEVECASCHDPHGVPSAGPGSQFIPGFLRVTNGGSTLCLTCHDK